MLEDWGFERHTLNKLLEFLHSQSCSTCAPRRRLRGPTHRAAVVVFEPRRVAVGSGPLRRSISMIPAEKHNGQAVHRFLIALKC